MIFKDHFSKSAPEYRKFRPGYPESLFAFLASVCARRETAWDCATGSGQAAAGIAPFFKSVIATDASEAQIRNAEPNPKISYMVCLSEEAALKCNSIDLVMTAQAAHWFDPDRFFPQVRKALRPGGIVTIWCYSLLRITPGIDRVIDRLYHEIVGPYWPPERKLVDQGYVTMYFPFAEFKAPPYEMEASWTLDHLSGYLGTWSAVNRFKQAHGGLDPVSVISGDLAEAWGDAAVERKVVWPIHMRIGTAK